MITDYLDEIEELSFEQTGLSKVIKADTDDWGFLACSDDLQHVAFTSVNQTMAKAFFYEKEGNNYRYVGRLDDNMFGGGGAQSGQTISYIKKHNMWFVGSVYSSKYASRAGAGAVIKINKNGKLWVDIVQWTGPNDGGNIADQDWGYGVKSCVSHDGNWLYVAQLHYWNHTDYREQGSVYIYEITNNAAQPLVCRGRWSGPNLAYAYYGDMMGHAKTQNLIAMAVGNSNKLNIYRGDQTTLTLLYSILLPEVNFIEGHMDIQFAPDDSYFVTCFRGDSYGPKAIFKLNPETNQYEYSSDVLTLPTPIAPIITEDAILTRTYGNPNVQAGLHIYDIRRLPDWAKTYSISNHVAQDPAAGFARDFDISPDESLVACASYGHSSSKGAIEIFLKLDDTYKRVFATATPEAGANDVGGSAVAYSPRDGLIAYGVVWSNKVEQDGGAVYIWQRDGRDFVRKPDILPPAGGGGFGFGSSLDFTYDGEWLIISRYYKYTDKAQVGELNFYKRNQNSENFFPSSATQTINGTLLKGYLGIQVGCAHTKNLVAALDSKENAVRFYGLNEAGTSWEYLYSTVLGKDFPTVDVAPGINKIKFSQDDRFFVVASSAADGWLIKMELNPSTGRYDLITTLDSVDYEGTHYAMMFFDKCVWAVDRNNFRLTRRAVNKPSWKEQLLQLEDKSATGQTIPTISESGQLQFISRNINARKVVKERLSYGTDHPYNGSMMGFGLWMSKDGKWLFAGCYGETVDGIAANGAIEVFEWENDEWLYRYRMTSPEPEASGQFGSVIVTNYDASLLIASQYNLISKKPVAYVYRKVADGYKKVSVIEFGSYINHPKGAGLALTADGKRLFVSTPEESTIYCYDLHGDEYVPSGTISGAPDKIEVLTCSSGGEVILVGMPLNLCKVGIFKYNKDTDSYVYDGLLSGGGTAYARYGAAVTISDDLTRIVVGCQNYQNKGFIEWFKLNEATGLYDSSHVNHSPAPTEMNYGRSAALSGDGLKLVVAAHNGWCWDYRSCGVTLDGFYLKGRFTNGTYPEAGTVYSTKMVVSPNGKRMALAYLPDDLIYLFKKENDNWVFDFTYTAPNLPKPSDFGCSMAFSACSNFLWVGARWDEKGKVYHIDLLSGQGTLLGKYYDSTITATGSVGFGSGLALDYKYNILAVGCVYLMEERGLVNFYNPESMGKICQSISVPDYNGRKVEWFGRSITALHDGLILVGARNTAFSEFSETGGLFILKIDELTSEYKIIGSLLSPEPIIGGHFGNGVVELPDRSGIMVMELRHDTVNGVFANRMYIYKRNGDEFILESHSEVHGNYNSVGLTEDDLFVKLKDSSAVVDHYRLTGTNGVVERKGNINPHSVIEDAQLASEPIIPVSL